MTIDVEKYRAFLEGEIFNTKVLGQFSLMFDAISRLIDVSGDSLLIVERSTIYGGKSIFEPLFSGRSDQQRNVINYMSHEDSDYESLQTSWLGEYFTALPTANFFYKDLDEDIQTNLVSTSSSDVFVANALHHCRDFPALLDTILKLNPSTRVHIFDSYIRESHQYPYDFNRFLIAGLREIFKRHNYYVDFVDYYGNIFDGILYLINQAEPLVKNHSELSDLERNFFDLQKRLSGIKNEQAFRSLGRQGASYESAYFVTFAPCG